MILILHESPKPPKLTQIHPKHRDKVYFELD